MVPQQDQPIIAPPAPVPSAPRSTANRVESYIVKAVGAAAAVVGALQTSGVVTGKYGEVLVVVGGALIALERYVDGMAP